MRSVFPPFLPGSRSLREVRGCPDHEGFSTCFPNAICFVSKRDRFSPVPLLLVSQACSPVLGTQLVPSVPESGSKHDWRPSHDR